MHYSNFIWNDILGGGFKYFLFSPLFVEDSQFDYFSKGLKPPTSIWYMLMASQPTPPNVPPQK